MPDVEDVGAPEEFFDEIVRTNEAGESDDAGVDPRGERMRTENLRSIRCGFLSTPDPLVLFFRLLSSGFL